MPPKNNRIAGYIKPMLATAVEKPFSNKDWVFELKLDGYRAIADINTKKVLLYSRNGLSLAERFPAIVIELKKNKRPMILDGEIVLLNENDKPDFQKLQNYSEYSHLPLMYYVFDILSLDKKDLTHLPLLERKKILKKALKKTAAIIYSDHIEKEGEKIFRQIKTRGMEGIMAKKKDSLYHRGVRTRQWLKIKNHKSQEAIIAGFTEPRGGRKHFGSLILAQYNKNKLQYIGHAGTGFSDKILSDLMKKMKPLITRRSPFDIPVKTNTPVTWLKSKLVAEVSFSEMTKDGIMRHPVYKKLRDDKKPKNVNQETEKSLPVSAVT